MNPFITLTTAIGKIYINAHKITTFEEFNDSGVVSSIIRLDIIDGNKDIICKEDPVTVMQMINKAIGLRKCTIDGYKGIYTFHNVVGEPGYITYAMVESKDGNVMITNAEKIKLL